MAIRVVQWTTGNVGKESVKAITANPDLELVGCFAWSPAKVGVDAGELAGIAPVGVAATDDVDALLALQPECVVYNPMWPSVDELVRILESGANVVATAAFITGTNLGAERDRVVKACEAGGTSIFGTGVSPGFAELVAVTIAGICNRIDKVSVVETADTTFYDSPDTERPTGFGRAIDDPELPGMARAGTAVFGEAVAMVADALGVELDEIVCEEEYAQTTEDVVMASWTIPAGHVAGVAASWQGRVGDRTVIELSVRWKKGATLDPPWVIEKDGWAITVEGLPTVMASLDFLPPPDFEAETIEDFMAIGHIITAVPALNAIPVVVAAEPGILTYADMGMPHARGWVRTAT
ncbi:MAG: dihydrodipicolinate reductase [Actinomycetota bacterium]|nr:dihydrodipicolinate reductase [Actinomycetota bacterium]